MNAIPTQHTDGDLAVGRNVTSGGNLTVRGDATVGHNLKVEGWLEARNLKAANKGLFANAAALHTAYPDPSDGWWAVVFDDNVAGTRYLGRVYTSRGGAWHAAYNADGTPKYCPPPGLDAQPAVTDKLAELSDSVDRLGEVLGEVGATASSNKLAVDALERSQATQNVLLGNHTSGISELNAVAEAHAGLLEAHTGEIEAHSSEISDLTAASRAHDALLDAHGDGIDGIKASVGRPGGIATLNSSGKVPSSQLPEFVDDVIEFAGQPDVRVNLEEGILTLKSGQSHTLVFDPMRNRLVVKRSEPGPDGNPVDTYWRALTGGEQYGEPTADGYRPYGQKIYVDTSTDRPYRWNGGRLVMLGSDLALGHTAATAFPGNEGVAAAAAAAEARNAALRNEAAIAEVSSIARGAGIYPFDGIEDDVLGDDGGAHTERTPGSVVFDRRLSGFLKLGEGTGWTPAPEPYNTVNVLGLSSVNREAGFRNGSELYGYDRGRRTLVAIGSALELGHSADTAFPGDEGAAAAETAARALETASAAAEAASENRAVLEETSELARGVAIHPFTGIVADARNPDNPANGGLGIALTSTVFDKASGHFLKLTIEGEWEVPGSPFQYVDPWGKLLVNSGVLFRSGNRLYRYDSKTKTLEDIGGSGVGNTYNLTVERALPEGEYYSDLWAGEQEHNALDAVWTSGKAVLGLCITFATAPKVWKSYQYVGPNTLRANVLNRENWTDMTSIRMNPTVCDTLAMEMQEGKGSIAGALTAHGVEAEASDTYNTLAGKTDRRLTELEEANAALEQDKEGLETDLEQGRGAIAAALNAHGVATEDPEDFDAMAGKIATALVPDPTEGGTRWVEPDLYAICKANAREDLPYMAAISTQSPWITLKGADGYLLSDGRFIEGVPGTGELPDTFLFDPHQMVNWAVYYYADEGYRFEPPKEACIELCLYNGSTSNSSGGGCNCLKISNHSQKREYLFYSSCPARILTDFREEIAEGLAWEEDNLEILNLPNLKSAYSTLTGSDAARYTRALLYRCHSLTNLVLPELISTRGPIWIAYECEGLKEAVLPKLERHTGRTLFYRCENLGRVSAPSLREATSDIIEECNKIWQLDLESLEVGTATIASNCSNLGRLLLWRMKEWNCSGSFAPTSKCPNLFQLYVPELERINGCFMTETNLITEQTFPRLKSMDGQYAGATIRYHTNLCKVSFPELETFTAKDGSFTPGLISSCPALTEISLPKLKSFGAAGYLVYMADCPSLELPELTTINGGELVCNTPRLRELSAPKLEVITDGGPGGRGCNIEELRLPALKTLHGTKYWKAAISGGSLRLIDLPVCTDMEGILYQGDSNTPENATHLEIRFPKVLNFKCRVGNYSNPGLSGTVDIELHFGRPEYVEPNNSDDAHIVLLTVEPGTVCDFIIPKNHLSAECLETLISNLGTSEEVKSLNIGTEAIARLSEEAIAMASAKNYTLS